MTDNYDKALLKKAIRASKLAASYIKKNRVAALKVNSSEGHDIKLNGDVLSEKIIIDYITNNSDYPIVSEEDSITKDYIDCENGRYWIIDPIDGTLNYSRGMPMSCISISLWENHQPVLGVINDFNRNEIFSGIVGSGAYLNKCLIRVSDVEEVGNAVLGTGFPSQTDFGSDALSRTVESIQKFKKIRLLGSAALSLAYVACGRFDAYSEKGIMFWDIAGGIAIVKAAGGDFSMEKLNDRYQYDTIVSNKRLFDDLKGSM